MTDNKATKTFRDVEMSFVDWKKAKMAKALAAERKEFKIENTNNNKQPQQPKQEQIQPKQEQKQKQEPQQEEKKENYENMNNKNNINNIYPTLGGLPLLPHPLMVVGLSFVGPPWGRYQPSLILLPSGAVYEGVIWPQMPMTNCSNLQQQQEQQPAGSSESSCQASATRFAPWVEATEQDRKGQGQWDGEPRMMVYKNRSFHNNKRTVQRLSKIPYEDLSEKQMERLNSAKAYCNEYKAMLARKYAEQDQLSQEMNGSGPVYGNAYWQNAPVYNNHGYGLNGN